LRDLGLTANQSSRYQEEASVPPDVYEAWIASVMETADRVLSAEGLRRLARRCKESGARQVPPLPFAEAETRLRRLVARLWKELGVEGDGRTFLLELLRTLSREYKGD
jgi:hypothetical protein